MPTPMLKLVHSAAVANPTPRKGRLSLAYSAGTIADNPASVLRLTGDLLTAAVRDRRQRAAHRKFLTLMNTRYVQDGLPFDEAAETTLLGMHLFFPSLADAAERACRVARAIRRQAAGAFQVPSDQHAALTLTYRLLHRAA